jgi:ubiquinone/menaquinone biosynthesis C-methylase UbiE
MDFSNADAFAAHFDDPTRDAWQKPAEVVSLLAVDPGQVVVDLGAGTGYFVGRLAKAVESTGRVLALDVEPNMVRHLEQRAKKSGWTNVEPRLVALDDPGLAPKSVDRVLIVNTWHHISDRERYAAKLSTALRPGGSVFVVDFTLDSDIGPPAGHRLSPEQVVHELDAGGLSARVVAETLPKQYVVAAGVQ